MDENKEKTVKFDPITEETIRKAEINRRNDDIYSERRKASEVYKEKESSNGLLYVAIVLAFIIVILLFVGVFMLGRNFSRETVPEQIENEQNTLDVIKEEEKEEEVPEEEPVIEEEKDVILKNDVVFYGDSVSKKNSGYSILADIYDEEFHKTGHRKIFIDDDTKIYENGKRMSAAGFVYTIESLAGEMIVVQSEIRDKDGYALTLKYDAVFEEEEPVLEEEEILEIPEEEKTEEEVLEENKPEENTNISEEASAE